jgi:hypothetical protein
MSASSELEPHPSGLKLGSRFSLAVSAVGEGLVQGEGEDIARPVGLPAEAVAVRKLVTQRGAMRLSRVSKGPEYGVWWCSKLRDKGARTPG